MKQKTLFLTFTLLVAGALSACAGNGYGGYGGYVAVRSAPPPPYSRGVVGYAPSPRHVWVDGFWDWRGGDWRWSRGYWTRPPRARSRWVSPRWEAYNRGYRFHRGYWR